MAGTYSKYIGEKYESVSHNLILINGETQSYAFKNNDVYIALGDNKDKLITAKMVRDSVLSIWDSSPFKITKSRGLDTLYIGVDNGDPANYDLQRKIYFGKRQYYDYTIMDDLMLDSDSDIMVFNTKEDELNHDKTRITILSGTNKELNNKAPYIETEVINNNSFSFNIINNQYYKGDIKFLSRGKDYISNTDLNQGGTVSINEIAFPSYQYSTNEQQNNGGLNNKLMMYKNNSLEWVGLTMSQNEYLGNTESSINIYGDLKVNSTSLLLTDSRKVPLSIGDIKQGETFNNADIYSLLIKLVYEYIPPYCSISLYNVGEYLEVGTSPNVLLEYTIIKRTNNTLPTILNNMTPSSHPSISSRYSKVVTGVASGLLIKPIKAITSTFTIKASDGKGTNTDSVSVTGVFPYFYGYMDYSSVDNNKLGLLTKIIDKKNNKNLFIKGNNFFYFIYDYNYGPLSSITLDGNNIINDFDRSVSVLSSPNGYWQSKQFYIYKCNLYYPVTKNIQFNY